MPIERALLSVFDKTGLVEFARRLAAAKIEIVSTGGTARLLREAGVPVEHRRFPGQMHAFFTMVNLLPGSADGIAYVTEQLTAQLSELGA